MADENSIASESYTRGAVAFVSGVAFFLVGLAAKVVLLQGAGRRA